MSDIEELGRAERSWASTFGDRRGVRRWWVPGRIEVLGKHVDYAGGRSLLAAVERGFHVLARPRSDARVRLVDARSQQAWHGAITADLEPVPGRWTDYPVSVVRRLARDFPAAATGMDAVLASSLPSASGLSSSSAMVIATFLPLAAFNRLEERPDWAAAIPDPDALAGYLGAVENGRAFGPFPGDFGVGTQGGSEDHTAILRCRANHLSGYRFLPVKAESVTALPADWTFVVASSGVAAAKAGAVKAHYNRLSEQAAALLSAWNTHADQPCSSLLDALLSSPGADDRLSVEIDRLPDATALRARLGQFREECLEIVPGVVDAVSRGDTAAIARLVERSHHLADTVLGNQVAETNHLADRAMTLGAIAASGFGAGFGGSVWALVPRSEAEAFREEWLATYLEAFPEHAMQATTFTSGAAPGACEVG